ncbi:hypothetical protein BH20ACI3_BH20ACI3_25140 [soil metagenome]
MQRFVSQDPLGIGGGDTNLYAYTGNNPISFNDPFGLEKSDFWDDFYKTWEQIADIRAAQEFWRKTAEDAINDGNGVGATGADLMNLLLDYSGLADIQEDAEILGSDAPIGDKIVAGGDIALTGASWFYGLTGKEIIIKDAKKCRIAPLGNRNWRKGYQKPHINQLPHYHLEYPGPGGSYKWHRPWQKGF